MKIITKGEIPKKPLPLWVGKIMTCPHCSTVVELEENDDVMVSSSRYISNSNLEISITCPVCMLYNTHVFKNELKIKKPF